MVQSRVSILVFVELALDGSAVAAPAILCISVSILVFVELALDGCSPGWNSSPCPWFQSLFSWNLLLMDDAGGGQRVKLCVSILVFVELALDV